MRDLKHLIFFENLLQEANNDLVKQAKAEGRRALGYTCNFMPEVLLDLAGCFSVRLRAPRSGSPDMATYYMSARTCHFGRSLMERALEGGFNFLDAQMATETCTVTCRFQEHLMQKHLDSVKDMDIIQNPDFFCEFTDVPFKKTENSYLHYRQQLQAHVLDPLAQNFGIDTSDEALLKAIEQHNEVCRLITEIGSYRKLDVPTITGYEFHVIQLASLTCPKVADRYCYGSLPGREEIVVQPGQAPLDAIARHYLNVSMCPRFMGQDEMRGRKKYLADLVKEYKADGIIVASNKFCEYWSYERTIDTIVLNRDFGIPVCSIEKEYVNAASGQLRTRFQAFIESVEIKKIQEGARK